MLLIIRSLAVTPNNVLYGLAGNDVFDGGLGIDTLVGGTGDDLYFCRHYHRCDY